MSILKERVNQFNALQLPGQPRIMHLGTSYLVNDLWCEVALLETALQKIKEQCEHGGPRDTYDVAVSALSFTPREE